MLDLLGSFVGELRTAGIPVSTTEHLDAARALVAIDLLERPVVKAALAATLVKDDAHYPAFDLAFEIFFSAGNLAEVLGMEDAEGLLGPRDDESGAPGRGGGGGGQVDDEEL